jgi:leader peptidase (prepilin peptidase)/N-methyltransferase
VTVAALVLVGLLGLVVGSFLNVVIHRLPRGESLVSPGSRCPDCGAPIRPWHNIPVASYLLLRGACAACGARIGIRYPLVEAGTAALFVALTARLAGLNLLPAVPAYLWFASVGLALAIIDVQAHRLPDPLVLPSYPVIAILLGAAAWWTGDGWAFMRAVLGGAAFFAFCLLVVLIHPAGMGFGDVKLAGLVGGVLSYLSWSALVVGAFSGFLLGAIVGVTLIALRRGGRKTAIPFGPFMVAAALLAVFVAAPIADWYLDLLQL